MAKKSTGSSKSQAVRDYLSSNPEAGPKEVVEKLGEQGVTVSKQLVNVVKAKMKSGGKKKNRVVKKPQQAATAATSSSSKGLNIGDLVETKKLVDQLGGAKQLRAALDALERLR